MPLEYVSHYQHATPKGATFIVVPCPLLYRPGDLMVIALSSDYRVVSSPPDGWTEIVRLDRKKDLIGVLCWKVATDNEPVAYRWSLDGRNTRAFASATIVVLRGADSDRPIAAARRNDARPNRTRMDAPSVAGVAGGVLICAWFHDDPQLPLAPPGMVQLSRFTCFQDGHAVAYELLARDGVTGIRTALLNPTIGGGGGNMSFSVVVRPSEP